MDNQRTTYRTLNVSLAHVVDLLHRTSCFGQAIDVGLGAITLELRVTAEQQERCNVHDSALLVQYGGSWRASFPSMLSMNDGAADEIHR